MTDRLPRNLRRREAVERAAIPPYTRTPITTEDGLTVFGWSGPAVPTAPTCKCSHAKRQHGADRRDRFVCFGSSVCGCIEFRPKETEQ